jgi:hypothetical protein
MGRVLALHHGVEPRHPLVFFGGRYASLASASGGLAPDLQAGSSPILSEHW